MSTREKRLAKLRASPRQVRFADLRAVLEDCGFSGRPSRGDHWTFTHPLLPYPVVVDPRRPFVLAVYVRNALKAVDALREKQREGGG